MNKICLSLVFFIVVSIQLATFAKMVSDSESATPTESNYSNIQDRRNLTSSLPTTNTHVSRKMMNKFVNTTSGENVKKIFRRLLTENLLQGSSIVSPICLILKFMHKEFSKGYDDFKEIIEEIVFIENININLKMKEIQCQTTISNLQNLLLSVESDLERRISPNRFYENVLLRLFHVNKINDFSKIIKKSSTLFTGLRNQLLTIIKDMKAEIKMYIMVRVIIIKVYQPIIFVGYVLYLFDKITQSCNQIRSTDSLPLPCGYITSQMFFLYDLNNQLTRVRVLNAANPNTFRCLQIDHRCIKEIMKHRMFVMPMNQLQIDPAVKLYKITGIIPAQLNNPNKGVNFKTTFSESKECIRASYQFVCQIFKENSFIHVSYLKECSKDKALVGFFVNDKDQQENLKDLLIREHNAFIKKLDISILKSSDSCNTNYFNWHTTEMFLQEVQIHRSIIGTEFENVKAKSRRSPMQQMSNIISKKFQFNLNVSNHLKSIYVNVSFIVGASSDLSKTIRYNQSDSIVRDVILVVAFACRTRPHQIDGVVCLGPRRLQPYFVSGEYRIERYLEAPSTPALVLSYEMMTKHQIPIRDFQFHLIICDEAHRLENAAIRASLGVESLSIPRRVLLTGTPLQKDMDELYAFSDFCNPSILRDTKDIFHKRLIDPISSVRDPSSSQDQIDRDTDASLELQQITRSDMLRRTETFNMEYLPPKNELILFCRSTDMQPIIYRILLSSVRTQLGDDNEEEESISATTFRDDKLETSFDNQLAVKPKSKSFVLLEPRANREGKVKTSLPRLEYAINVIRGAFLIFLWMDPKSWFLWVELAPGSRINQIKALRESAGLIFIEQYVPSEHISGGKTPNKASKKAPNAPNLECRRTVELSEGALFYLRLEGNVKFKESSLNSPIVSKQFQKMFHSVLKKGRRTSLMSVSKQMARVDSTHSSQDSDDDFLSKIGGKKEPLTENVAKPGTEGEEVATPLSLIFYTKLEENYRIIEIEPRDSSNLAEEVIEKWKQRTIRAEDRPNAVEKKESNPEAEKVTEILPHFKSEESSDHASSDESAHVEPHILRAQTKESKARTQLQFPDDEEFTFSAILKITYERRSLQIPPNHFETDITEEKKKEMLNSFVPKDPGFFDYQYKFFVEPEELREYLGLPRPNATAILATRDKNAEKLLNPYLKEVNRSDVNPAILAKTKATALTNIASKTNQVLFNEPTEAAKEIKKKPKTIKAGHKVYREPKVLSGKSLLVLSRYIEQGLTLAVHLDIPDSTITGIGFDSLSSNLSLAEVSYKVLTHWKRNTASTARSQMLGLLLQSLNNMNLHQLAEIIKTAADKNEELIKELFKYMPALPHRSTEEAVSDPDQNEGEEEVAEELNTEEVKSSSNEETAPREKNVELDK